MGRKFPQRVEDRKIGGKELLLGVKLYLVDSKQRDNLKGMKRRMLG